MKAQRSVLSAVGSSEMAGASRWLDASAAEVRPNVPAAARAAVNHAIQVFIARSSFAFCPEPSFPNQKQRALAVRQRVDPRVDLRAHGAVQAGRLDEVGDALLELRLLARL